MPPKQKLLLSSRSNASMPDALRPLTPTLTMQQLNTNHDDDDDDDDDDFQSPSYPISSSLTQKFPISSFQKPSPSVRACPRLQKPHSNSSLSKKQKRSITGAAGKENIGNPSVFPNPKKMSSHSEKSNISAVDLSSSELSKKSCISKVQKVCFRNSKSNEFNGGVGSESETGCLSNLIESRLMESSKNSSGSWGLDNCSSVEVVENGTSAEIDEKKEFKSDDDYVLASIDSFEPIMSCSSSVDNVTRYLNEYISHECGDKKELKLDKGYLSNSIESRLIASKMDCDSSVCDSPLDEESETDFDLGTQLNVLMGLCSEEHENENTQGVGVQEQYGSVHSLVKCPLCGIDISHLNEELRQMHTNDCLDRDENEKVVPRSDDTKPRSPQQVGDVPPVLEWLRSLGLSKYEEAFAKEEIDWDTLQWLTEEDLLSIGVTALGPRKKIVHALTELRNGNKHVHDVQADASKVSIDEPWKLAGNKLITQYFPGSSIVNRKRDCTHPTAQSVVERSTTDSGRKRAILRNHVRNGKVRDIPSWCCIPGTPFRVDAFRYLRRDCTHWFLSHFHIDHYQGLTRSFCHGKIYCSSITARLVHMKIGVPLDRLEVLPLNEKIRIDGVDVTCLDANHCPGSVIILFEPPNGKAVLHTGDFRFSEAMANISILRSCPIQTLILDTTYCNPQYDFPKQEAVIQFVIDAIQAEAFNPKTLFLIGSYTIGKERLFLEVARCLRKKVYVGAAKLHLLQCLGLPDEDMQWFTLNEQESHIHVVPMWTIASFKRMKHLSNQYSARYNLIVAFSPTGWTFGKGKKKSPGRRWKQGTIIRYEVPYSEHCSFTELKEFVQFISPENIIPSVNNDGLESADAMIALLMS